MGSLFFKLNQNIITSFRNSSDISQIGKAPLKFHLLKKNKHRVKLDDVHADPECLHPENPGGGSKEEENSSPSKF